MALTAMAGQGRVRVRIVRRAVLTFWRLKETLYPRWTTNNNAVALSEKKFTKQFQAVSFRITTGTASNAVCWC